MLTPLVAGLFALAGVVLGVMLEPIKARFAARARAREDRFGQCAELIEAALVTRSRVVWLNRLHRRQRRGDQDVTAEEINQVEEEYWEARHRIRRACLLLELRGPDGLAEQAKAVREADYQMRKLWRVDDNAEDHRDRPAQAVAAAADDLVTEVDEFTKMARRYTR